jgi:hypothetical protein
VRPRFEVAGGDPTRLYVIKMVKEKGHPIRGFDLMEDLKRLEILIENISNVIAVGIDPVSAYMGRPGKLDSYRASDIRAMLMPLHELAARRRVGIIGLEHFNKNEGTKTAILRVGGSIASVAAPRAGYAIVRDEDNEERRLFLRMKNNNSKIMTGLAFRVIDKLAPPPVFDAYPALKWESDPIKMTAHEALAQKKSSDGRKSEKLQEAIALLKQWLEPGPQPTTWLDAAAIQRGISPDQLRRAKNQLPIRAERRDGRWWWILGEEPF